MKTKIIPFDLETAKKIQAGELAGSIKTKNGLTCKIVSYCDGTDFFVERKTEVGYCRWCYPYTKDGRYIDGHNNGGTDYDLVLEVADDVVEEIHTGNICFLKHNELKEPQFKPFDKVLVRMCDEEVWRISLYGFKHKNGTHSCINTSCWNQCIPYEGNEHLVGTTDKPKEE